MTSRDDISKRGRALRRLMFVVAFAAAFGAGERADARDGVWTIRCAEFGGPRGLEVARQLAETLKNTPGIRAKNVFVMEGSDEVVRLYYGRYRRRTDPKTRKRSMPRKLRQDLDLMRELVDETGRRYFMMCVAVRVPVSDAGNPDWVLRNVHGVYTLQVAVFEPTDNFIEYKKGAAAYCALLRKRGYEAYYHHTEVSSMVTVGVFGADATRRGRSGRNIYSREVAELQRDELMKHNITNGAIIRVRNDAKEFIAVPSYLVKIPDPSDSGLP
ncbi:MAG: hypothetical protein IH989_06840 [Planctomycetes bacterium]|nr:hypothetical protein [Planctomycetota bacterium]